MPRLDRPNQFSRNGKTNFEHRQSYDNHRLSHDKQEVENQKPPESIIDLSSYVREPKYSLEDVILPEEIERQFQKVLAEIKHHVLIYQEWGMGEKHKMDRALGIVCAGSPGTGKSMSVEALAHTVKRKVLEVPSIASKYMGDTEKIIEAIFDYATSHNLIIIWNEADRDFGKRLDSVSQSADAAINSSRSILLDKMSSFSGVIALTTNKLDNFDSAFIDRMRFAIKYELPNEEARARIWQAQIPNQLPLDNSVDFKLLASQFSEISGREIKKAVLNAVVTAANENKADGKKYVTQSHFIQAMEEVIAIKKAAETTEVKLTSVVGDVKLPPPPDEVAEPS